MIAVTYKMQPTLDLWYTVALTPVAVPHVRGNWQGRALRLFFRLNADMLNYTPLSAKARRAARIMPQLVKAMEVRGNG